MNRLHLAALALLVVAGRCPAGPKVDIIVAADAPKLERFAAGELAAQLKRLFEAEVTLTDKVPLKSDHLIVLGSPKTNPAVKRLAGARWPKLSDQGHVLRSVEHEGKKALVVGGGSPVATLWAAYELGHHFGIRYFLHEDVLPASAPALQLDGIDKVLEPTLRLRAWRTIGDNPAGMASWGLDDQKRLLGQLAKLKFNRVVLEVYPWQPFVHYEGGAKERKTSLWRGPSYPVDGDTPGRHAFRGASVFDNPEMIGRRTDKERLAAGVRLARGIIDHAHEVGMTASLAFFPLGVTEAGARSSATRREQEARALVTAYVETYPRLDALELILPMPAREKSAAEKIAHRLLGDTRLFRRKGGAAIETTLGGWATTAGLDATPPKGTGRLVHLNLLSGHVDVPALLAKLPAKDVRSNLHLSLGAGVALPYLATTRLHALVGQLRNGDWEGYSVACSIPGDVTPDVHYLARAAFDAKLTPARAHDDLIRPWCGEGATERAARGFELIEKASALLDRDETGVGIPSLYVLRTHYREGKVPASWGQMQKLYAQAMDEMYRAQQRAPTRVGPRLLYHAKRLEFALGYLDGIANLRQAGLAKTNEKKVEQLEKAMEAMYNALNALGEVARDQSDRGVIAVLNAHAYRPIQAELEKLEKGK